MVELAELLTDLTKRLGVLCQKRGDITLCSIMIARFYTGKEDYIRQRILSWRGALVSNPDSAGTIEDDCKNGFVDFNDIEGLKK